MATAEIDSATKRARERFDGLSARQVIDRLPRLSDNGLEQVLSYEQQTKARATVLDAAQRELRRRAHSDTDAAVKEVPPFGTNRQYATPSVAETIDNPREDAPLVEQEERGQLDSVRTEPTPDSDAHASKPAALPWVAPEPSKDEPVTAQSPSAWELAPEAESLFDRARRAIGTSRGRAIALAIGVAIIALLIGVAVGKSGTVPQSRYDSLRAELTKSRADTASARQDAAQAESKAQTDEQTQLNQARAQDQAQLQQQQAALSKQQADAQAAQTAAQDQAQQNAAQRAALDQRQAAVDANSFSDGLYQVGKDIQPGRYHTNGGSGCYWAKLSSSDTSNISDNNFSPGPQTVSIDSPYFESNGCGTWTKVG